MQIDGACLCGYLSYEAVINPDLVMICHCSDCQTTTGSYHAGVLVNVEDFVLRCGTPKVFYKMAESGRKRALSFCPDCGVSLYGANADNPKTYSLRLGTIRQRSALKPKRQIWTRSRLPWVTNIEGIEAYTTQPEVKL